jgi:hypothetical protein
VKNTEALPERNKRIAKLAAARVVERIERFRKQLGVRPWEGPELTPEQADAAFALVVDDPEVWRQLVAAERELFHLSPDRVPKRLYQEVAHMFERQQHRPAGRAEEENGDGSNT